MWETVLKHLPVDWLIEYIVSVCLPVRGSEFVGGRVTMHAQLIQYHHVGFRDRGRLSPARGRTATIHLGQSASCL